MSVFEVCEVFDLADVLLDSLAEHFEISVGIPSVSPVFVLLNYTLNSSVREVREVKLVKQVCPQFVGFASCSHHAKVAPFLPFYSVGFGKYDVTETSEFVFLLRAFSEPLGLCCATW